MFVAEAACDRTVLIYKECGVYGRFKGYLFLSLYLSVGHKILPVHWNFCSLKKKSHNAAQEPGSISAHYVLFKMTLYNVLKPLSLKKLAV